MHTQGQPVGAGSGSGAAALASPACLCRSGKPLRGIYTARHWGVCISGSRRPLLDVEHIETRHPDTVSLPLINTLSWIREQGQEVKNVGSGKQGQDMALSPEPRADFTRKVMGSRSNGVRHAPATASHSLRLTDPPQTPAAPPGVPDGPGVLPATQIQSPPAFQGALWWDSAALPTSFSSSNTHPLVGLEQLVTP